MSVFALRYARALSQVAVAGQMDVAAAQAQLGDFADTLDSSRDLREVLTDPSIAMDGKLRVLDGIAGKLGMRPQVRNFIAVVMEHQRLPELREILAEFAALADRNNHVVEAEIVSAHPLHDADRAELEQQVARLAGGNVRATYKEDASLLGGAVVRIGSTVYDGSVKAQLAELKRKLVNAQVA